MHLLVCAGACGGENAPMSCLMWWLGTELQSLKEQQALSWAPSYTKLIKLKVTV